MSWFVFSISSVILFGISTSFYKLPAKWGHNKTAVTFWSLVSSEVLALIFFWKHLTTLNPYVMVLAALWGLGFALLTTLQMYALEHVDTNTLFPVTTTLSLVIAILFGLSYFGDRLSWLQYLGILLSIVSVYSFLYKKGKLQFSKSVLVIGGGVVLLSAFNRIIKKFAADVSEIYSYQIWESLFGLIFALLLVIYYNRKNFREALFSGSFKSGLAISIPSFFGGWLLLVALMKGPFSLVSTLHSAYIFITAIVGYLLFKENLDARKIFLMILAIIAIVLIRLG